MARASFAILSSLSFLMGCLLVTNGCVSKKVEKRGAARETSLWLSPIPEQDNLNPFPYRGSSNDNYFPNNSEVPQASERYVFVPDPSAGSIAIVDSSRLTVTTLETGSTPSSLQTIPNTDAAIVLNVGANDATIIRVSAEGDATQVTLPTIDGANTLRVSPDGRHAIAFVDLEKGTSDGLFGDFQSVSVLTLEPGAESSTPMTVGFKPSRVSFDAAGTRAIVVTDVNLSILNYAAVAELGSDVAPSVKFGSGDVAASDIVVTQDGQFAFAQQRNSSLVRLLDLTTKQESVLDLADLIPSLWMAEYATVEPANLAALQPFYQRLATVENLVTAPDGSFGLGVLDGYEAVVRIPIPGAFVDPTSVQFRRTLEHHITHATIVPRTTLALAYTRDLGSEEVSILDFGSPDAYLPAPEADAGIAQDAGALAVAVSPIDLRKSIESVVVSPDGETVLIVHGQRSGSPFDTFAAENLDVQLDRSAGFTLLRPTTRETKLQITSTRPSAMTFSPDGRYLFLLFNEDSIPYRSNSGSVREVHRVSMDRFVVDPIIRLDSPPLAAAPVPGQERIFVSQQHPDGRLTFIDWNTAETQTVTGFELNSRVRN